MNKSPKLNARAHIIVDGVVQGVFFRASTKSEADRTGVYGWVRNNSDGTVEIVAEGKKEGMEEFVKWCHEGPPGAVVENIKLNWEEYQGEYKSFDVVYY